MSPEIDGTQYSMFSPHLEILIEAEIHLLATSVISLKAGQKKDKTIKGLVFLFNFNIKILYNFTSICS